MENLLLRYIQGEATAEERLKLEDWIAASADNEREFKRIKSIWENSRMPQPDAPDVEEAWQRFLSRRDTMTSDRTFRYPMSKRRGGRWKVSSGAAALLIIALTGYLFYWNSPVQHQSDTDTAVLNLPDHSVVTLNSGSKLSYKRSFNRKERVVTLEGEGFFDVARDPGKPFLIHVKDVDVMVLGTSFNIRSTAELTEVTVETGLVKITREHETFSLSPDQKIIFRKGQAKAELSAVRDQLYQYYRTNVFVCDKTPVNDLVQHLEDAYAVEIRITNPYLAQQHLTSKFSRSEKVEDILEKVALTLNARLEQQGAVFILK